MKIFKKKTVLKSYLSELNKNEKTIGFVPTMGALHQGHLSLVKNAQKKCDVVVVSIFVNPTQFDNIEDLKKYPKTLIEDLALLKSIYCDVVYVPTADEIYDGDVCSEHFDFEGLEFQMEGKFRDGHFDGVGTIVKKLFEIVEPNWAFFGEKDFQQLQIIKKMVEKNKLSVKVKGCDIFRDNDGLAMSSRNLRLTNEYRNAAPFIYETLKKAKSKFQEKSPSEVVSWVEKKFKEHDLLELEYFTIADESSLATIEVIEAGKVYRGFIAVFAGDVRLIDTIRF